LKTRRAGIQNRIIATVLAGSLGAAGVLPAGVVYAQTAKPAAAAPPAGGTAAKPKASGVTGGATASATGTTTVDAKKAYGSGEKKFKDGDYAGALADFQAADSVKETPQAARYIGLCQDNLQHFAEAVVAYDRFLANVPAKLAVQGDEIRKRVEVIKAMPAKVHVDSDPKAATISLDGKAQPLPTPADLDVPAGHHTIKLTADGREDATRDIDATFASKQDVMLTLPSKAPPPVVPVAVVPATPAPETPVDTTPAQPRSKLPAWITGGLAVAAAGVGTAFGVLALGDKSDYDKSPTAGKADDGENHALIADMAFGVAVTLGVTSAVLFLSNDDAPPANAASAPRPSIASVRAQRSPAFRITPTPIITPHGGGAGALVRF
jgi:hypothetical protein